MPKNNQYSSYLAHDHRCGSTVHDDNHHSNLGHCPKCADEDHNDHEVLRNTSGRLLMLCLIVTFAFAIVEAIGGILTHSIALQSDSLHMLADTAGLFIAYLANIISRKPATVNLTFGYGKAEAVGVLINCIFTVLLTAVLLFEIIHRFFIPMDVHGKNMFLIATMGLIVNIVIALILSTQTQSLNIKSALIHTLGDLLGSVSAIVAGIVIYFTHINIIDPILSLVVIVILLVASYKLIKKSLIVLMAGVPDFLDYEKVGADLSEIDGILEIHDLHIWYLSTNKASLSAHIVVSTIDIWPSVLSKCQNVLLNKHNISHITLQHELPIIQSPCN